MNFNLWDNFYTFSNLEKILFVVVFSCIVGGGSIGCYRYALSTPPPATITGDLSEVPVNSYTNRRLIEELIEENKTIIKNQEKMKKIIDTDRTSK